MFTITNDTCHSQRLALSFFALLCGLTAGSVQAQQVTVQQPALGVFSGATTVVVPDRGSAHLGSLGRAGSSRSSYGPLPSGSSRGQFHEHAGMQTRVWIHDLREMDEQLLNARGGNLDAAAAPLPRTAEHAYRTLTSGPVQAAGVRSGSRRVEAGPEISAREGIERHLRFADAAEERGRPELARLHLQMAAKQGSTEARERLANRTSADPVENARR